MVTMPLFKQLWSELSHAASELGSSLKTDLSHAGGMLQDEARDTSTALSEAIAARCIDLDDAVDDIHRAQDTAVHDVLTRQHRVDTGAYARRARAVLARLSAQRPAKAPVSVVVLHWSLLNALVLYSDRIYLTTALMDALPDDAALAFVLGHELTHIDLGHNRLDGGHTVRLPPLPPMLPLKLSLGLLTRTWMRPDMEREADAGGQALSVAAGYRADGFEAVFDMLAAQTDAVVEPEDSQWDEFWRQKASGYPTIAERRRLLAAHPAR